MQTAAVSLRSVWSQAPSHFTLVLSAACEARRWRRWSAFKKRRNCRSQGAQRAMRLPAARTPRGPVPRQAPCRGSQQDWARQGQAATLFLSRFCACPRASCFCARGRLSLQSASVCLPLPLSLCAGCRDHHRCRRLRHPSLPSRSHTYLDVRTPQEFDAGHAPGAVNVPVMLQGAPPHRRPGGLLPRPSRGEGDASARARRPPDQGPGG